MNKPQTYSELLDLYLKSPLYTNLSGRSKLGYQKKIVDSRETGKDVKIFYTLATVEAQDVSTQWYNRIAYLNQGKISNFSRNAIRQMISTVYQWGVANFGVASYSNPTLFMPRLPVEIGECDPFDTKEIELVKKAMLTQGYYKLKPRELWTAWVVRFLFETGMRPREMMDLRLSDVVYDDDNDQATNRDRLIQIIGAKGREAGKISRFVFVTKEVELCLEFFAHHRATRKNIKTDRLIVGMRGCEVHQPPLHRLFHGLMERLELTGKVIYDLRRGCATEIINNPMYGINVAMKQLGHKSIITTQRYEHLKKKRAAKLFKGH